MKLKLEFDPEPPSNSRRWSWPIRSIGQLMIVIALSGLLLSVIPRKSRRPGPPAFRLTRVPGNRTVVQEPVPGLPSQKSSPRHPFVIIASAEIDPEMVVQADPDLDGEMVFNPDTGRRGSSLGGRSPGGRPVEPAPRVWSLPPSEAPQAPRH